MPVTKVHKGCQEIIEVKSRVDIGYEVKICGKPIHLDGVCAHCWRKDQALREDGIAPMRATGGVAEQMNRQAYKRLHVEDETLIEKGIDRDVRTAMVNFDDELRDLLGPSEPS